MTSLPKIGLKGIGAKSHPGSHTILVWREFERSQSAESHPHRLPSDGVRWQMLGCDLVFLLMAGACNPGPRMPPIVRAGSTMAAPQTAQPVPGLGNSRVVQSHVSSVRGEGGRTPRAMEASQTAEVRGVSRAKPVPRRRALSAWQAWLPRADYKPSGGEGAPLGRQQHDASRSSASALPRPSYSLSSSLGERTMVSGFAALRRAHPWWALPKVPTPSSPKHVCFRLSSSLAGRRRSAGSAAQGPRGWSAEGAL